jgi:hypothetical protein
MSKYLKNKNSSQATKNHGFHKPFAPTPYGALSTPLVDIHYSTDLIHKRVSYSFWKQITETINNKHLSPEEKVRGIHLVLNERMMFSTNKQAGFDAESAEQAILDII